MPLCTTANVAAITILLLHVADAWASSTNASASAFILSSHFSWRPSYLTHSSRSELYADSQKNQPSVHQVFEHDGNDGTQMVIQKIELDDSKELERMSKFCIDAFYGGEDDDRGDSLLSRRQRQRFHTIISFLVAAFLFDSFFKSELYADSHDGTQMVIQQIGLDDSKELERMSKFCIDAFYGGEDDDRGDSLLSRKWKDIKLGAMQKAQLLDISLSSENNRCIFVAKSLAADSSDEIIGCCEVIEEQLDIIPSPNSEITISERERRKTARPRPVIENLCVDRKYRRSGIGVALVRACEKAVEAWPGHNEIFAQVEDNNYCAFDLFTKKCGYQLLFADPTCTEVMLEDAFFAKEITVTKRMLRKFL
eukprot:CAMPEP_0183749150 /NCGR_PEP_ID=MMETSP0737-20130205/68138_1 /TAXON_ID=385413 /ORGANISM="Thalassiosira miniscula, Strain CCMP1093" /LENGTH=365 /DNA_ID=CAMNT_0025984899 /DNA_START=78 /DNA_END=1176 /DNA_ORIENTATION=+